MCRQASRGRSGRDTGVPGGARGARERRGRAQGAALRVGLLVADAHRAAVFLRGPRRGLGAGWPGGQPAEPGCRPWRRAQPQGPRRHASGGAARCARTRERRRRRGRRRRWLGLRCRQRQDEGRLPAGLRDGRRQARRRRAWPADAVRRRAAPASDQLQRRRDVRAGVHRKPEDGLAAR